MHISEGVLGGPVLITGATLAVAGTAVGLKKLDYDQIARAGILAAAFFVASLIHVPLGPSSVHLILNGIVGLLLGWTAFPVILVALLLQAILFQFGGLTTLGVNTVVMATPAVIVFYVFGPFVQKKTALATTMAFACGFGAVLGSGLLVAAALVFSESGFLKAAGLIVGAHVPVMIIEGFVTAFCVAFLKKVQPSLLAGTSS